MGRSAIRVAALAAMSLAPASLRAGTVNPDHERSFARTVRPFLVAYCVSCHGGTAAAAQLDLQQYASAADVVRDHARWALVAEKLAAMEMPPNGVKLPPAAERQQVIDWVHAARREEARKHAGDPGLVLACFRASSLRAA